MKRIVSVIISLAMMSAICVYANETDAASVYSLQTEFAVVAGIFDQGEDFAAAVTRADFAQFIYKMLRLKSVQGPKMGEVSDEALQEGVIETIVAMGYMNGIGDGSFGAERGLSVAEAVETLLSITGYDSYAAVKGGYPTGYLTVANDVGMTKGIKINDSISRAEIAALVYNLRNVCVLSKSSIRDDGINYSSDKEKTFMTEILKINEARGVLTDNGITTLVGKSILGKNIVKINEDQFSISEKTDYIRDFIGREISAYYKYDKNDKDNREIFFALKTDKESVLSFSLQDFVGLSGTKITYMSNDKLCDIGITVAPYVIFNGLAEKSLDPKYFGYEYGSVTVFGTANSNGNNVVIIEAYYSAYVSDVDFKEGKIYLNFKNPSIKDGQYVIENKSSNNIRVINEQGKKISFTEITPYSFIDISKNGSLYKIILTRDNYIQNITFDGISENEITSGGTEYKISKDYLNSNVGLMKPVLGEVYNMFKNSFGFIVWFENATNDSPMSVGYLVKAQNKGNSVNNICQVKLLTDTGSTIIYDVADKFNLKNNRGQQNRILSSQLITALNGYRGLIQYKVSSELKITFIALPFPVGEENDDGSSLRTIMDQSQSAVNYRNGILNGKVVIDINTKIFKVDENIPNLVDDKDIYSVITKNDLKPSEGTYKSIAYTFEKDSPLAKYMVIFDDGNETYKENTLFYVDRMSDIILYNGEKGKAMYGYEHKRDADMVGKRYTAKTQVFEGVRDCTSGNNVYNIKAGDIIRICATGDELKKAVLVFRCDTANVLNPDGGKGALVGTLGYFDKNAAVTLTNPIGGSNCYTSERYVFGSVLSTDSMGNIVYTTQDLSYGSYDKNDQRFLTECIAYPKFFATISFKENNKYSAEIGKLNDIRAYNECGNDCSRIFIYSSYVYPNCVFIINF